MEPTGLESIEMAQDTSQHHIEQNEIFSIKIPNIVINKPGELLGSVTTFPTSGNDGPAVRTSARVIKLRMDSTPLPAVEKKESPPEPTPQPKTPIQAKPHVKIQWVNSERNFFFDALNEYGRDFEQIARFINTKMKRKAPSDQDFKTSSHIKQHYYQLFHKVSKYLRFSNDVKKEPQELYTLINYGEIKRKCATVPPIKIFPKLGELVYKGSVVIRVMRKNIKVKTPSCRALRMLNRLEGNSTEDVQLPLRIDVILRPQDMKSWGYVQTLAQNPRVRLLSLPLQKRLASLIYTMQQKWQVNTNRFYEKYVNSQIQRYGVQKIGEDVVAQSGTDINQLRASEPTLCFMPPRNAVIHRPMVQLNELLSSYNICLNSYEERIGAKTRGDKLCVEKSIIKDLLRHPSKRMRFDSASEKLQKVVKVEEPSSIKISEEIGISVIDQKSNDSMDNDLKRKEVKVEENLIKQSFEIKEEAEPKEEMLTPPLDIQVKIEEDSKPKVPAAAQQNTTPTTKSKKRDTMVNGGHRKEQNFKPLIDEEMLKKIRRGWTPATVGDLTIGDLYLMFGSESKIVLDYQIVEENKIRSETTGELSECTNENKVIGSKLKSLLSIASLLETTTNNLTANYLSSHGCERPYVERNNDQLFKQPGPRTEVYNRPLNSRSKAPQERWRQNYRPRPLGNLLTTAVSLNHEVKVLYETPAPAPIDVETNKPNTDKQTHDKYVDVDTILEKKIQDISGRAGVNHYTENSNSSMRRLLDCFTSSGQLPKGTSISEESSFSIRLLQANAHMPNEDLDSYSLSSFLLDDSRHDQGI